MNRRDFLKSSGAAAIAMSLSGCLKTAISAGGESSSKPNIILCMTDDQGWGDVSYNGLKHIQTPSLDAMAAAGVQFNRFYVGHPSCSPCRASVLTGRNPNRMGTFWPGMPIRAKEMTIAQAAKKAGYATAHFGKWHLNGVAGPGKPILANDPLGPLALGFDEMFSVSNYFDTDWTFSRNGENVKVKGDGSDAIVAEALTFIEKNARKGTPFLALVWFGSPHSPNKPTAEDQAKAGGSTYYGELVGVDRAMGTLRAGLRRLGVADNTMVVFNSDNGGWPEEKAPANSSSNGPLRGRKGDLYEGGIRVPGLIEWPARVRKPFVSEVPVSTVDMYPTIVDILKVKIPNQVTPLDGMSILPVLDGQVKERPKPIGFWQYDDRVAPMDTNAGPSAWMEHRYKLVKVEKNKYELYDVPADISEKNDIAAANPEIVNRMKAELENWHQGVLKSNEGADYK